MWRNLSPPTTKARVEMTNRPTGESRRPNCVRQTHLKTTSPEEITSNCPSVEEDFSSRLPSGPLSFDKSEEARAAVISHLSRDFGKENKIDL